MSTPCAALARRGDSRSVSPDRWKVLTSIGAFGRAPRSGKGSVPPSLSPPLPLPRPPRWRLSGECCLSGQKGGGGRAAGLLVPRGGRLAMLLHAR